MRVMPARLLAVLAVLLLALAAGPAAAQKLPGLPPPPAPPPAAASDGSANVEALLRVLQNDKARAALIARLQAAPAAAAAPAAQPAPKTSFAGRVADYTGHAAESVLAGVASAGRIFDQLGYVLRGTARLNPATVGSTVAEVAAVIAVTFAVYLLLRWLALRFDAGWDARAGAAGRGRRLALLLVAILKDALAVIVAWGAGYAFALAFGANGTGGVGFSTSGRISFSQTLFLNAFLAIELIKVVLRLVTVPVRTHLRLLPLSDADAAYWYFWSSRLASLVGYALLFAAPLLFDSGSWAAAQALRIVTLFTAMVIVVVLVLKNRHRVRAKLRRRYSNGQTDMVGRLGAHLGTVWHYLVILYVVAVFLVWLANPYGGLDFMMQATLRTLVAAGLGMAAAGIISHFISSGLRVPQSLRDRLPLLEARLNALVPAVLRAMRLAVLVAVLLSVVQIWGGLNITAWFTSGIGQQASGAVASAVLILLVGGAIHVAAASWVEYRLNPNYGSVPTPRETTLLALFRNAFTIALLLVGAMLVLSQLGVNIAPLLAGAGVLGLAIGFGAQKLVQDVITGAFIQFENAMNVGEVVNAAGIGGVVERLTIRSVSIRDLNGVLHIIPFSSVDKVSNLMRHFSYHVAEIGVAYRENIAEVKEAMQQAFELLQKTDHGENILDALEMHGITAFGDSAITVRARIKTLPGKQWAIGRAYNEIIKEVFDARGIEIPFPHMTLYMGEDKQGNAPPLNLRGVRRQPPPPPAEPVRLPEAGAPVAEEEGEQRAPK
jgi:small conductance mechanosensitive channel